MIEVIEPSIKLLTPIEHISSMLERIKYAGCTCYQSYETTKKTPTEFVNMLLTLEHTSVLEHESLSINIICDRGVSHELIRHRLISVSQESTRYCNYANKPMEFILPNWFVDIKPGQYVNPRLSHLGAEYQWLIRMINAAKTYNKLIEYGWTPQQARSVLPNSLKTELVITANLREWLHIIKLRTVKNAHPQMQQVINMIKEEFHRYLPELF
jgi:thymidylate synthase (FAD)